MDIYIDNRSNDELTEKQEGIVRRVIEDAGSAEAVGEAEVSLSIVENEEIQALNQQYRGMDKPTDVLSFPQESAGLDIGINILGDIVISLPKAREQAEEYGHSLERELGFLACHGMLHLLGYDHMNEDEAKVMYEKQEKILQDAGVCR